MGLLTGNSAMMDPDAPQAFSDELDPEEEEGDIERGTKDCLVVSNTTDHDLVIKLDDVDMVRRDRTRQKNFGVGGNIAGSANIEVGVGEAGHERLVMKASGHWVYRHTSSEIALPSSSVPWWHGEKAGLLHNSLFIRPFYIDASGAEVAIGKGCRVGPGHGLIVSKLKVEDKTTFKVEEAAKRKFWKKFDPWMTRGPPKVYKHPHDGMERGTKCSGCGERIRY